MTKAYAYIRYSRAIQATGDSENRQLTALELFETSTGTNVVEVVYDKGKSAFRGDNARSGNFKEMLDRMQSGAIRRGDYLVVESIDRITRQRVLDGVELLQGILKKGINIYTTVDKKTYSYNDPSRDFENLLMISLIAKRANEESETKSGRLLSAWKARKAKAENGEVIIKKGKSIPYGLRVEEGKFVIHKEEQEEIKQLFELLLQFGINTAITKINETSLKKWNNGTLNKVIKHKTVIGCMATHRVEYTADGKAKKILTGFIENYYPNLIEPKLFYKAIDVMANRKQKNWSGRRTEQDFNIFKHCIFCAECGGKLYYDHRGSRYKGKIYPFFKCDNARVQKHVCTADNIRFEYVLGSLLDSMKMINRIATEFKRDFKGISTQARFINPKINSLLKADGENNNLVLEEKQKQLISRRTKLDNMNTQMVEADYNVPTKFIQEISKTEKEIEALNKEILLIHSALADEGTIDVQDTKTVIDLFMTDEGRAKLNYFFKTNDIIFLVSHKKATRETRFSMRRKNELIDEKICNNYIKFPLKDILGSYGLGDLQTMFDLSVS
ncbi:Resolvase domain-containing protein [Pseudomonas amygdali pv. mori]|uniref:Resolvase domain-containing protein n=1 Tax=Pseudomonas amygdali pv. mori TaxID=34065 RepID=A0A3M5JRA1_PSEA0|nr:recombinase family protein [Pseudomonas amygdali]RMT25878.1 Resolvase domain-containing protein [Pseudomonas amygdali pv. mori]